MMLQCIHRGESKREQVQRTIVEVGGAQHKLGHAVFVCSIHGECLPNAGCAACYKDAVSDVLSRDVKICHGCEERVVR